MLDRSLCAFCLLAAAGQIPGAANDKPAGMPEIAFASHQGGTQVFMNREPIVEFRRNRYLRFRATSRNDLWVGSEWQPMDLCWAYSDAGINDFVFRKAAPRLTGAGFEVVIEADKPSLAGQVRIELSARWLPAQAEFEYTLKGALSFQPAMFYRNSAQARNSRGPATIEPVDWHIEHVALPERVKSKHPASPGIYDWFVHSEDRMAWKKSPKVHIPATRPGSYPTINIHKGLERGGVFGWLDQEQGGWLVYPESAQPGQKHGFTLCWMYFDVHVTLPGAVPPRDSPDKAALSYALRFAPAGARAARSILQKAAEVEWRGLKEYQLPVMRMGRNDFRDLTGGGDGQYMWWASSYDCYRDDRVGFDDTYSVSIRSAQDGPKAWYAACFGKTFQLDRPLTERSFRVRAMVKTKDCDGWVGIGATPPWPVGRAADAWVYGRSWPEGNPGWVRSKPVSGTSDWREITLDVVAAPGSVRRWTVVLEQHGKGQSWWDNVVIEELGDAPGAGGSSKP